MPSLLPSSHMGRSEAPLDRDSLKEISGEVNRKQRPLPAEEGFPEATVNGSDESTLRRRF